MFKSKEELIETIFKEGELKAYPLAAPGKTMGGGTAPGIIYENKDLGLSIAIDHYHLRSKNRELVKKLANLTISELVGKWK